MAPDADGSKTAGRRPSRMRRIVGPALGLLLVAAGGLYLWHHRAELVDDPWQPAWLLPMTAAQLALIYLRGSLLRLLCGSRAVLLGGLEAAALAAWSSLANYVTPVLGGVGVRGAYLRRRHGLSLAAIGGLLGGYYLIHYTAMAAFGLAVALTMDGKGGWAPGFFAAVVVAGVAAWLVPRRLPLEKLARRSWPGAGLAARADVWRRQGERLPWASLGSVVLAYAMATTGSISAAFAALGRPLPLSEALFIALLTECSALITLTPGALGVMESAIVFAAVQLGLPPPLAVAAAGVKRAIALATAGVAGACGWRYLRRRGASASAEPTNDDAPG